MKMRVHTYFKRCMVFFATLCVILISNHSVTRAASGQGNSPMLMVDKYTVENEKIVPGQDFTLTLTLKNYSNTNTAKNIMLNVENPEGVAPVYGTTSQVFVGTLGPEKTKEVSIKYRSWASIQDESLDFTLTIVSDQPTNQVILRSPVGADSPLNIISSSVSTDVQVGESGSAVISFEALAENNVSDITLILREGDTKIASSSIGNVTAGSTKSKKLPFYIDKEGKHEVEMLLQYNNQLGQTQEVSLGKWTVNVTQASTKSNTANIDQIMSSDESNVSTSRIAILGVSGAAILGICILIVVLLRKRR